MKWYRNLSDEAQVTVFSAGCIIFLMCVSLIKCDKPTYQESKEETANNTAIIVKDTAIAELKRDVKELKTLITGHEANETTVINHYKTVYENIIKTPDSMQFAITVRLIESHRAKPLTR